VEQARLIAAVDIDGVLADVRHRLHHVEAAPKDWAAFFAAAPEDPVLDQGVVTVTRLAEVFDIMYLSGRPERCRADTLRWFEQHDLPPGDLVLRPPGDRRPAAVVKVEALDRVAARRTVALLVDDDPLVLDAARRAGYDVLPADWMPAQESLREAQEVEGET